MKYLYLIGQYEGQVRDFGDIDESAQRIRKIFAIENYETYKSLDEVGKAVFLANAQSERGIVVSELDKKKAVAQAATSQKEKESKAIIESDAKDLQTDTETINTEAIEAIDSELIAEESETQTIEAEQAEENALIEELEVVAETETTEIESLRAEYLVKTGNKVPPRFSNNADWIKTKL